MIVKIEAERKRNIVENNRVFASVRPLHAGAIHSASPKNETSLVDAALGRTQTAVPSPAMTASVPQISEAEHTKTEIHTLLNRYPELGMNQGYVAALSELPSGIIVSARKADPITARAVLNKALAWKDRLLEAYPDLAQRPAQFAMALETPEEYLMDCSGGKQAGKEYAGRFGGAW